MAARALRITAGALLAAVMASCAAHPSATLGNQAGSAPSATAGHAVPPPAPPPPCAAPQNVAPATLPLAPDLYAPAPTGTPPQLPPGDTPSAVDGADVAGYGPDGLFVATPTGLAYVGLDTVGTPRLWLSGHLLAGVDGNVAFVTDWGAGPVADAPGFRSGSCSVAYDEGTFAYCAVAPGSQDAQATIWDALVPSVRSVPLPHTADAGCDLLGLRKPFLLYTPTGQGPIYLLNTGTGNVTTIAGTDQGAFTAAFAGSGELLLHPTATGSGHDLLLDARHPDAAAPVVTAPAGGSAAAGQGYIVDYAPARHATVVYPAGAQPYTLAGGIPAPVHGRAGFVVHAWCDGFMYPALDANGLPRATPVPPPFPDIADVPDRAAILQEVPSCLWLGFPDGTFGPELPLTRAELATLWLRLGHLTPPSTQGCFIADVPLGYWALKAACAVIADGLMGSPRHFGPEGAPVTVGEFAQTVARWLHWDPPGMSPQEATASLQAHGVSLGTLTPDHVLSRAAAAELVRRLGLSADGGGEAAGAGGG